MPRRRYKTVPRLWAISSVVAFVALGFIDPVTGMAKGDNNLWSKVLLLPTLNRHQLGEIVPPLFLYGGMLALTAAVLGWVVQALIVASSGAQRSRFAIPTQEPRGVKS